MADLPIPPARQARAFLGDVRRLLERIRTTARQIGLDADRASRLIDDACDRLDRPGCVSDDVEHLYQPAVRSVCSRCGACQPDVPLHSDTTLGKRKGGAS